MAYRSTTTSQGRNYTLPIKRRVDISGVALKDVEVTSFIHDDTLWSIKEIGEKGAECFEIMTGRTDRLDLEAKVDPVDVQIILHPLLSAGGFQHGRDCGKGWENS